MLREKSTTPGQKGKTMRRGPYCVTVYRTAFQPPWFTWNRYPSRTIGAAVRVGDRRCLSITWAHP